MRPSLDLLASRPPGRNRCRARKLARLLAGAGSCDGLCRWRASAKKPAHHVANTTAQHLCCAGGGHSTPCCSLIGQATQRSPGSQSHRCGSFPGTAPLAGCHRQGREAGRVVAAALLAMGLLLLPLPPLPLALLLAQPPLLLWSTVAACPSLCPAARCVHRVPWPAQKLEAEGVKEATCIATFHATACAPACLSFSKQLQKHRRAGILWNACPILG